MGAIDQPIIASAAPRADSASDQPGSSEARNASKGSKPPVYVMNPYYTGIGIGRSLYGKGAEIVALASEHDAPGVRSRYFSRVVKVPNSRDDPAALAQHLVHIARMLDERPVLFPTRDADVLFQMQFAHELTPFYRLPKSLDVMPQLLDKLQLAKIAETNAIPTPRTFACSSEEEIREAANSLRFPVVIKPRSAHEWRRRNVWDAVGARKAIQAHTPNEMFDTYRALAPVSPEVLVQEYVPGNDAQIVVCCCYIGNGGRVLGHFTARKLRQNPPSFGTGCLVEATDIPEIIDPTLRLLRAVQYSGMAEVEFKQDATTGSFELIEVNPRHWDQHALGLLVGVNLSDVAYRDLASLDCEPCKPVYGDEPARWIAEREALDLWARAGLAPREVSASSRSSTSALGAWTKEAMFTLRGRKIFAVCDTRDPVPGLLLAARMLREALHVLVRRFARAS